MAEQRRETPDYAVDRGVSDRRYKKPLHFNGLGVIRPGVPISQNAVWGHFQGFADYCMPVNASHKDFANSIIEPGRCHTPAVRKLHLADWEEVRRGQHWKFGYRHSNGHATPYENGCEPK